MNREQVTPSQNMKKTPIILVLILFFYLQRFIKTRRTLVLRVAV